MSNVEISESEHYNSIQYNEDNEVEEAYENKGYSKIPLDQINLNTEPITINNDFRFYPLFDMNAKSYIKVILGFIVFIIVLFMISILSGHFHYETEYVQTIKDDNFNSKINYKQLVAFSETPIKSSKNIIINESSSNNNTNNNASFN